MQMLVILWLIFPYQYQAIAHRSYEEIVLQDQHTYQQYGPRMNQAD
jgi:hypothetical protein